MPVCGIRKNLKYGYNSVISLSIGVAEIAHLCFAMSPRQAIEVWDRWFLITCASVTRIRHETSDLKLTSKDSTDHQAL